MTAGNHKSFPGFSLMELLVAMTLLSIVMASVYTFSHSAVRTWRHVEGGFDIHLEARNAMTLFSHEYNNIVGRAGHLFEGKKDEIIFFVIAQPVDLEQGEGARLMRVVYSYNRGKKSLEREEALVETALPKQPPQGVDLDRSRIKLSREFKTTVAENVSEFSMRYIWVPLPEKVNPDEPPVAEPPIYQEEHRERWGLPQGIEVKLVLDNPDDEEQRYAITSVLPMHAPSHRRMRKDLENMLSGD